MVLFCKSALVILCRTLRRIILKKKKKKKRFHAETPLELVPHRAVVLRINATQVLQSTSVGKKRFYTEPFMIPLDKLKKIKLSWNLISSSSTKNTSHIHVWTNVDNFRKRVPREFFRFVISTVLLCF